MKIEMGKKYQTRSGQPVRLFCTDADNEIYSVIGEVKGDPQSWKSNGTFSDYVGDSLYDLIEIPEPIVTYQNVFSGGYASLDDCISGLEDRPTRIGHLKTTITGDNVEVEFIKK